MNLRMGAKIRMLKGSSQKKSRFYYRQHEACLSTGFFFCHGNKMLYALLTEKNNSCIRGFFFHVNFIIHYLLIFVFLLQLWVMKNRDNEKDHRLHGGGQ